MSTSVVTVPGPTRRAAAAGFTLIEVLIAALILATVLIALSTLFALGLKNNAVAKEDTIMAALAQDKIEQLRRVSRSALEEFFIDDCQGSCDVDCECDTSCDDGGDCCPSLCYPDDPDCTEDDRTFQAVEDPVSDPNPDDRVKERFYVRIWEVEKVNLGQPVGCVYKLKVVVGSRNGLYAPEPPGGGSWVNAGWSDVVGDDNPRRVVVAAYRR